MFALLEYQGFLLDNVHKYYIACICRENDWQMLHEWQTVLVQLKIY